MITCSQKAQAQAPSKLWLPVGGQITVDTGLRVLIVQSANDVAVMLAEAVAGNTDAFVARMNEAAQKLGMTRTHYENVNGLPQEGQVTTARDLAKLTRAIIVEFPEYADIFALSSIQVGKKLIRTHNRLLVSFQGADGMKTGFICDSGFNIVASATRDGRRLVAVVLGEPSVATRTDRAANLLENGFKRYFWKSVFGTTIDGLAMVGDLEPDAKVMKKAAGHGHATATDLADWLVREAGLPFREAHHVTGRIVALADTKGCDLAKLTLEDLKSVDKRLTEDAFSVLDVSKSVKSRRSYGGTAPGNVRREAKKWIKRLKKAPRSR